jgi:hydrogenase nickel incorporation protein HypA/HybF
MHELSLMAETLAIAVETSLNNGATRIHSITLQVGELSGIVPEALSWAFDACIEGTIAAEATLKIEYLPVHCYCPECGTDFIPTDWIYMCPYCSTVSSQIQQGRELFLSAIEIS